MEKQGLPCMRCGGTMETGFVADKAHYSVPDTQKWVEGPPEHSFWSGLRTKDREVIPVITFRCESCGWLDSYAQAPAT